MAWLPWLTARVITLFALGLAKYEVSHFHITNSKAVLESHDGLLGSDAGWYQTIAAHGYGALPRSATRFFPLLPLLDRGLSDITSLTVGIASLVITNAASLLLGVGIYALVRSEFQDTVVARRAVWLIMLAPPAFVFVMGYSEALLVLLAVAFFVNIRRGNWWWPASSATWREPPARSAACWPSRPPLRWSAPGAPTAGAGGPERSRQSWPPSPAQSRTSVGSAPPTGEGSSNRSRSSSNKPITERSPILSRPCTTRSPTSRTGITSGTRSTSPGSGSPSS